MAWKEATKQILSFLFNFSSGNERMILFTHVNVNMNFVLKYVCNGIGDSYKIAWRYWILCRKRWLFNFFVKGDVSSDFVNQENINSNILSVCFSLSSSLLRSLRQNVQMRLLLPAMLSFHKISIECHVLPGTW